jgi:hypothetical protein
MDLRLLDARFRRMSWKVDRPAVIHPQARASETHAESRADPRARLTSEER